MMFSRLLLATAVALQCVGLATGGAESTATGGDAEAWNPRELPLSSYEVGRIGASAQRFSNVCGALCTERRA